MPLSILLGNKSVNDLEFPEHLVDKTEKGFLVIGYGKLGGIELGFINPIWI